MKYTDIAAKSMDELTTELKAKKLALFQLNSKLKTMQLKNTQEIRDTKKDIARIMTAMTAKKKAN